MKNNSIIIRFAGNELPHDQDLETGILKARVLFLPIEELASIQVEEIILSGCKPKYPWRVWITGCHNHYGSFHFLTEQEAVSWVEKSLFP